MSRAASSSSRLTAKGRATRARIVDAAARLMYENGAANTSFEDVRKAAKASGSQMSHYFADKRSLIRAVIGHQADAVMADHHDPAIGNLDSIAALRVWARRIVEQQRAQDFEGGCRLGSLAAELVESDAELRADFAAGFERWEALLRRGLLTMQQRGDLAPDADPDALARSLLAAVQGGYLLTQAHRDVRGLEDALGAAIDHIESLAPGADERSPGRPPPPGDAPD
ncbi:MAG: TetR family transcriptional regulator [Actinobacteria bacterium]|nr:TetR family transcriptional regulator [Actinomycetota bacterium]